MAPKSESSTIVPDSTVYPPLRDNDTWLLEVAKIQVLHEATLQDLLQTRNDAVTHILHERNELLRERESLGVAPCEYSEVDFLTPVEPTLPYRIINGQVARHHTKASVGARHPPDRRKLSKGTQTEDVGIDADTTLLEIDPPVDSENSKNVDEK